MLIDVAGVSMRTEAALVLESGIPSWLSSTLAY